MPLLAAILVVTALVVVRRRLRKPRPCPACRGTEVERAQPAVLGWSPWEDDWRCRGCGHRWSRKAY